MQATPNQPPIVRRKPGTTTLRPNGFVVGAKSCIGPGDSAREIREPKMTRTVVHATTRHRGESSLPVGKSNMTNRVVETAENCIKVESHAAYAPPGSRVECESATVAYWPEKNCIPPATAATRKSQPMMFPGRRGGVRAPWVAQGRTMRGQSTQMAKRD